MQYFEATLLSIVLMLAILADVLRFPLIRKDRGKPLFCRIDDSLFNIPCHYYFHLPGKRGYRTISNTH